MTYGGVKSIFSRGDEKKLTIPKYFQVKIIIYIDWRSSWGNFGCMHYF
jgi:hypothetical protein